ncbi:MAG: hypothetical protein JWP27_1943 [Flaviaesturariibacter sp.]|nr:hypothetical protein [Flaviaesturariibacter sp.]
MASQRFENVDMYIAAFPAATQARLKSLRRAIRAAAPKAEEVISYNMPAYKYKGVLAYFAAYAAHVGFYPTAAPLVAFAPELTSFVTSKGTVRFPLDRPIPQALVKRMVRFQAARNEEKELLRQARKSGKRAGRE